jgi:hypothetical protein
MDALFDQFGLDAIFAEGEANEAGMRTERMMIKLRHA